MARIIKYNESFITPEKLESTTLVDSAPYSSAITDNNSAVEINDQDEEFENITTSVEDENITLIKKVMELEEQISDINQENNAKVKTSIDEGFNLGVEKGRSDYSSSVQDKLNSLDELFNKIMSDYKTHLFGSTDDLIDVIFTSVTKIIAKQYSKDTLIAIVNESINEITDSETIKLHVSSDDVDSFDDYKFSNESIQVIVDSRVQHGGCIVESNKERLDSRLDKKIEIFKNLLMDSKSDVS